MPSEDLAADGEAADIGAVLTVRDAQLQETGAAELLHQCATGVVRVGSFGIMDRRLAPSLEIFRQLAVARLEERPNQVARVRHRQSANVHKCSQMFTLTW